MTLAEVQAELEDHLQEIADLFVPGVHLTLLMRNPAVPETGGLLMTDEAEEDLQEVLDEVKRRWFK